MCVIIQYAAYIGEGTPIGGVYSVTQAWTWELRRVTYASHTDIVQFESTSGDISEHNYYSSNAVLEWTVDKEAIGIRDDYEGIGQELVNTWAAIWNADDNPAGSQRDPHTQAWDHAHTHHTDSGENYPIHGTGDVFYNVILSVDESEKITFGGEPTDFQVRAFNNGTHESIVDFSANPTPADTSWSIVLSPNSTTISPSTTKTVTVTITPPKNVENGSVLTVRIGGSIHEVEGNNTIPVLSELNLMVIALASPNASDDGGWWDVLMDNLAIIVGVIAVVVLAVIILVVLTKK